MTASLKSAPEGLPNANSLLNPILPKNACRVNGEYEKSAEYSDRLAAARAPPAASDPASGAYDKPWKRVADTPSVAPVRVPDYNPGAFA